MEAATLPKLRRGPKGYRVHCIEDGLTFETAVEAGEHYGIDSTTILEAIRGFRKRNIEGYVLKINKTFAFQDQLDVSESEDADELDS